MHGNIRFGGSGGFNLPCMDKIFDVLIAHKAMIVRISTISLFHW